MENIQHSYRCYGCKSWMVEVEFQRNLGMVSPKSPAGDSSSALRTRRRITGADLHHSRACFLSPRRPRQDRQDQWPIGSWLVLHQPLGVIILTTKTTNLLIQWLQMQQTSYSNNFSQTKENPIRKQVWNDVEYTGSVHFRSLMRLRVIVWGNQSRK